MRSLREGALLREFVESRPSRDGRSSGAAERFEPGAAASFLDREQYVEPTEAQHGHDQAGE